MSNKSWPKLATIFEAVEPQIAAFGASIRAAAPIVKNYKEGK